MPVPPAQADTEPRSRKPRARRDLARQPEFRHLTASGLEVRAAADPASGLVEVTGQVIVYDTAYQVNDMWGSFNETIHYGACTALLAGDLDVRFLFNHRDMPLARTGASASLMLEDSPEGLNVRALLDPRMSSANDLIVALEQGLVTQMSIGMEVDPAGDVWSGQDDWGMPDTRDIYRLAGIFDASAVTFPASPSTSISLAQRMWESVPVQTRERTRRLWSIAKEARQGRTLSQADSDALLHVLEQLHAADRAEAERADPTPADAKVADALAKAQAAVSEAIAAQAADPDNNTDPADAKVWAHLEDVMATLTQAIKDQAVDGSPDDPAEEAETKDADEGDADGTDAGSKSTDSQDGTGRSAAPVTERADVAATGDPESSIDVPPDAPRSARHAIDVELDLLRLRHRPLAA